MSVQSHHSLLKIICMASKSGKNKIETPWHSLLGPRERSLPLAGLTPLHMASRLSSCPHPRLHSLP